MMAKPMLVTLPFVMLLLDYWPLQRLEQKKAVPETGTEPDKPVSENNKKAKSANKSALQTVVNEARPAVHKYGWAGVGSLLIEKIPFFALIPLFGVLTYIAEGSAVASIEELSPGVRIANALVSYIVYIGKTIWPVNLAVFYPHPASLPLWQVLGAVLLLIAVTVLVIRTAKRFPYLTMGWLWFTGTLVPVIGIVQVGSQAMADRYTYIPLIGLFVMAAWGIPELLKKWLPARFPTPRKKTLFALSSLVLLSLFIVTRTQVGYWRNNITLYDHSLKVSPSDVIYCSRGVAYAQLGDHRQAILDYDRAIEINSEYAGAYNNRAVAYAQLGNHRQAISDYDRVIEIDPELALAYLNRGKTYRELGDHRHAISDFDRAIEIDPKYAEAYYNRGRVYNILGNYRQAISDFDRAIEIGPENAGAYNNRGVAHGKLGNHRQAISDFDRAIDIAPGYSMAYYNRGIAHAKLGNFSQAIEDLQKAARLDSEDAKK
jgi:tetratricopeptide (TPR) repeat protein